MIAGIMPRFVEIADLSAVPHQPYVMTTFVDTLLHCDGVI